MNAKLMVMCCVISAIVSTSGLFLYDHFIAEKIIAADTTQYLKDIRRDFVNGRLSEQALDRKIETIRNLIQAQPENVVIIKREVILSNNVDTITPD